MPPHAGLSHERSDAEPRLIAWLAVGVAAFLVLAPLLLMQLYPDALRHGVPRLADATFPPPRLEIDNSRELAKLRQSSNERLATFGWIDRQQQIVHLTIDRAIQLTSERGLAGWPKP
jgi:hypothetical protein